jgi:hypothetical protein
MIKLLDILREAKQVGDIYHFTKYHLLPKIITSGKLRPSPARSEQLGYISFSRDKILGKLGPVRITINGDKLSEKYKISPYVQPKPETKYDEDNWAGPFFRSNQNSESELIIPSKKYGGSIDILPYIKKIDIMEPGYIGSGTRHELEEIKKLCDEYNIPVEFHKFSSKAPFTINWKPHVASRLKNNE